MTRPKLILRERTEQGGKKQSWKTLAPEGAVSGKSLMNAGIMLPVLWGEYGQMMIELTQCV